MQIQIAQTVAVTAAEGPGLRYALWFQGCPLRCPGCCNPEMLPFTGGHSRTLEQIVGEIDAAAEEHEVEGITLLGGEPFAHAEGAAALARHCHANGLSVMVFSGFQLEELQRRGDPMVDDLLAHTDILVDGPYERDSPDTKRRWIGSTNQRIHFLSDRYRAEDECWQQPDTLELRLVGGELSVNGFPARQATGLWRRVAKRSS